MSLVPKEDMDKLRTASQSAETAATAELDVQLKAIAYQINTAANTGQNRAVFQEKLVPGVKEELESKGYKVEFNHNNPYDKENQTLISWE